MPDGKCTAPQNQTLRFLKICCVVSKSRCPVFIASEVSGFINIRVIVFQAHEHSCKCSGTW
jgi:hypothetical protein